MELWTRTLQQLIICPEVKHPVTSLLIISEDSYLPGCHKVVCQHCYLKFPLSCMSSVDLSLHSADNLHIHTYYLKHRSKKKMTMTKLCRKFVVFLGSVVYGGPEVTNVNNSPCDESMYCVIQI